MTRTHTTVFVLVAIVALVLGLTVNKVLSSKGQGDPAALLDAGIVLLPQNRSLPALKLVDQDGKEVAVDQLKGDWKLLFFGYTFCPDICPATLAQLRQLQTQLPEETRARLEVVMVSVSQRNGDVPSNTDTSTEENGSSVNVTCEKSEPAGGAERIS